MNNEFIEGTEEFYHWAFYDEELTKINWIKQALLNKER